MKVDVLVYDGFDELDAIGPYEVFGHAARSGADLDVAYAALTATPTVTAALGTTISVQRAAGAADLVVVPGGGWQGDGSSPGSRAEALRGELPRFLAERHLAGAVVAGVCTGGMLLAEAGLLRGLRATTHHTALAQLADYDSEPVSRRVVDEGSVVTAGGVTSGLDLELHLVDRFCGPDVADLVARNMEHTRIHAG